MTTRLSREATAVERGNWELLPLRFHRFAADVILLTNLVGEHCFLTEGEFLAV